MEKNAEAVLTPARRETKRAGEIGLQVVAIAAVSTTLSIGWPYGNPKTESGLM